MSKKKAMFFREKENINYDISSITYDSIFLDVTAQTGGNLCAIEFKPDGKSFWVMGYTDDVGVEFSSTTAWDSIDNYTPVPSKTFDFTAQDATAFVLRWNPDGTMLWMGGLSTDDIYQYTASTAWDISSLSYDVVSFAPATTGLFDFIFKPDGTEFYILSNNDDRIKTYEMSTAWDISTAVVDATREYTITTPALYNPRALFFNPNGNQLFHTDLIRSITQLDLSTLWDASSGIITSSTILGAEAASPESVFFTPDGTRVYLISRTGDIIRQYSL